MLEVIAVPIAIALLAKLDKKVVDQFWGEAIQGYRVVINQDGTLAMAACATGRTYIRREYTVASSVPRPAHIIGNIYLPTDLDGVLVGTEIAIVLVSEETTQQTYLFVADLSGGYELYLPAGLYSSIIFLMDATVENFFDAKIVAVGFPSFLDLTGFDVITVADYDNIWKVVSAAPKEIKNNCQYSLEFVPIGPEQLPGFPQFFADFLQDGDEPLHDIKET